MIPKDDESWPQMDPLIMEAQKALNAVTAQLVAGALAGITEFTLPHNPMRSLFEEIIRLSDIGLTSDQIADKIKHDDFPDPMGEYLKIEYEITKARIEAGMAIGRAEVEMAIERARVEAEMAISRFKAKYTLNLPEVEKL